MRKKPNSVWNRYAVEEQLDNLDARLPGEVNRRRFLKTSLASITGVALAGCLSNEESGDDQSGEPAVGDDVMVRDIVYRTAIDAWPNYVEHYAADRQGFYSEAGISPPQVEAGFGSGDTSQRIGTGTNVVGSPAFAPSLSAMAEGGEMVMFGMTKARSQFGAAINTDMLDGDPRDPNSWEGASIIGGIGGTAAAELSLIAFLQEFGLYDTNSGNGDPDGVEMTVETTDSEETLFLQQEGEATWQSLNTLAQLFAQNEEAGENFGTDLVTAYSQLQLAGYPHLVYEPWLSEDDDNPEYLSRLLEGYSHALKWAMLNVEDAIDLILEVNPDLEIETRESLIQRMAGGVIATNLAPEISQEAGLGAMLREPIEVTTETYTELLPNIEDGDIPPVDEFCNFEIQEDADLATLSDEEFEQAASVAEGLEEIWET